MPEHQANTDEIKEIKLSSAIQQVIWTQLRIAAGAKAGIEIFTQYVGNNSDLEIELSDHAGKKHGMVKGKISANYALVEITVPAKAEQILYANVKMPKHSLEMKSNPLLVLPPIEISNLKWDKKEARRGDVLKLTADVKGAKEGDEAEMEIWEHDADGAHDLITKFPVTVKDNKVEVDWEYEYHEDTDDIPTKEENEKGYKPPEYFFRVSIAGTFTDSDLLGFKDWIEIKLKNQLGQPIPNEKYELTLPDGSEREGTLDDLGTAIEKDVPPGKCTIHFPEL
jgi:hypothetical protein